MNFLDQRIKTFASQGLSPYEIEEKLGIKHYTIHIEHHEALMAGYSSDTKSEKKLAAKERKREYQRTYEADHRKERARKKRQRYANDPEFRERMKNAYRRYRETHAAEISERNKERYRKKKEEELSHV